MNRIACRPWAALALSVWLVGCGPAGPSGRTETIALETLNASGVTGTVGLVEVGRDRTAVEIRVEPGANPDMPAHIHPGSCANLVPQPKYPLENVRAGESTTVVAASFEELLRGNLAVNLHRSADDLQTYTACADLR
jgi:hypothetical protein